MSEPIRLPAEHPLSRRLADEVHARPPVAIERPGVISALALLRQPGDGDDFAPLLALLAPRGVEVAPPAGPHAVVQADGLRIKWERHSEFTSYTFVRALADAAPLRLATALEALPPQWLVGLPGQLIKAVDITFLPAEGAAPSADALASLFGGPTLVGSGVSDAAARVYTDFQLGDDGRGRWLVLDARLTRGQRARVVQRLLEIDVYRVMAMLAFPVARALAASLTGAEARLSALTARIAQLGADGIASPASERDERALLDDLTRLAADVEHGVAASAFRFAAAKAYWQIVQTRIIELREDRLPGMPTISEFLGRRLAPAIDTVTAAARRQEELSARVARASELLRTRIDIAREEQNHRLLAAMERRGKLSLRLQQTVEGLSVVAITYYAAGLVGYLAKALHAAWPAVNPDWVAAAAVPILAVAIWRGVHRVRRELARD